MLVIFGVALCIYFITSSDSGSWCDDTNSAGGLLTPPAFQRIYWCWTEGLTAICLLLAGEAQALKAVRGISIVAGLPWTFALCFMCTSVYRAVKQEEGEMAMTGSGEGQWATSVFDVFEGFKPTKQVDGLSRLRRFMSAVICFMCPALPVGKIVLNLVSNEDGETTFGGKFTAFFLLVMCGAGELLFVTLMGVSSDIHVYYVFAWLLGFLPIVLVILVSRINMRKQSELAGNYGEDFVGALFWHGFTLSQMELQITFGNSVVEKEE